MPVLLQRSKYDFKQRLNVVLQNSIIEYAGTIRDCGKIDDSDKAQYLGQSYKYIIITDIPQARTVNPNARNYGKRPNTNHSR